MSQGEGIDPTAQLHYQTQIFIKAPLSTVWRVHTDLEHGRTGSAR